MPYPPKIGVGRNCRICAATYDHWKLRIYGIPVWSWDTEAIPAKDTKNYFDQYLAYRHEHEWTGGGYATYRLGMVGCGRSNFGPYPRHQRELTAMGLRLVAAGGMPESRDRQAYFKSIIQPGDIDHYIRVRRTFALIDEQRSKRISIGKSITIRPASVLES